MTGLGKRLLRKSLHWSGDLGWSFCLKEMNKVAPRNNFHTDCVLGKIMCEMQNTLQGVRISYSVEDTDYRTYHSPSLLWTRKLIAIHLPSETRNAQALFPT